MKIAGRAARWLSRFLILHGVEVETEAPPEFIVKYHAADRMINRIKCKPDKIVKLTLKAWNSKESVKEIIKNRHHYYKGRDENVVYRALMGYVFVFKVIYNRGTIEPQKILITVHKNKSFY